MLRSAATACAILALAACAPRDRNTWHPAPPGGVSPARAPRVDEPVPRRFAVVFAPVAIGDLAAAWPGAAEPLTYDLAERIDALGAKAEADGLAAPDLPAADAAAWRSWPVPGTSGADLIVLVSVLSIERREGSAGPGGRQIVCTANVEMRALDAFGNLVFHKRAPGGWSGLPSPKFPGPEARPEAQAAWDACSGAAGALLEFLEKRNEATLGGPAPAAGEPLVEMAVESEPSGADVLVDGIFRGNTPCTLKLPTKRLAIRLELGGHAPWERTTIPEAGLRMRPVLEKK